MLTLSLTCLSSIFFFFTNCTGIIFHGCLILFQYFCFMTCLPLFFHVVFSLIAIQNWEQTSYLLFFGANTWTCGLFVTCEMFLVWSYFHLLVEGNLMGVGHSLGVPYHCTNMPLGVPHHCAKMPLGVPYHCAKYLTRGTYMQLFLCKCFDSVWPLFTRLLIEINWRQGWGYTSCY